MKWLVFVFFKGINEIPCNCTVAEIECVLDALEVKHYDSSLSDLMWQNGWIVVTEHSDLTDPCAVRVSIRLTRNENGDVRIQIVKIEFGRVDGEFTRKVLLCQDSGLRISTTVSTLD